VAVAVVNPRFVRAFARSISQLAKTDRLDALPCPVRRLRRPPVGPNGRGDRGVGRALHRRRQLTA
jgi:transposase